MSVWDKIRKEISIKNVLKVGDAALDYVPKGDEIRYNIDRLNKSLDSSADEFARTVQGEKKPNQAGFALAAGIIFVLYILTKKK